MATGTMTSGYVADLLISQKVRMPDTFVVPVCADQPKYLSVCANQPKSEDAGHFCRVCVC